MATRPITITDSDPSTGRLELSDRGHTPADAGDTILWHIGQDSGVYSITSIEEKDNSDEIFSPGYPRPQGVNWRGEIRRTAPVGAVYRYSIWWKPSQKAEAIRHDPIISIRPRLSPKKRIFKLLLKLFLVLFGISIFFWLKKKK